MGASSKLKRLWGKAPVCISKVPIEHRHKQAREHGIGKSYSLVSSSLILVLLLLALSRRLNP